jgi:hypothetical protein
MTSYAASLSLQLLFAIMAIICASLICYALRTKGDVSAELSHGKTIFRINAKDKRPT